MSLKPLKKSDLGKDWVKNDRYVRKIGINPEYHLIVTEGTDTEPNYFEEIRRIINEKYSDRIVLKVEGKGDNTLNLFEKARQSATGPNDYKHVWIVYDTDDFPAERINKTAELCRKTEGDTTRFHAIWSNQCIELWFLLHFGFYQTDIHRKEYWPKLTEWLSYVGKGKYKKNRKDMYTVLRPYMDFAIENAKKLDRMNAGKTPSASAPGTKVYELIEVLRPYL
ncbi:RloB-like protein [[Clostridium] aminophilum]|uniref:RloB-like protein n=1 Tax=[Clostridium] aminophilum TaxID=1526 RepID=A0A1I0EE17_9FIRM|nr:RloB family protein [[Clostridium] aminophilum]SET43518.1 RloB-like protein [[Clostridium] aminophilum]